MGNASIGITFSRYKKPLSGPTSTSRRMDESRRVGRTSKGLTNHINAGYHFFPLSQVHI